MDAIDIAYSIAEDNLEASDRFSDAVDAAYSRIAEMPGIGALRDYNNSKLGGDAMSTTVIEEVMEEMSQLSEEKQRKILDFTREIRGRPRGLSGADLARFAGWIPLNDLEIMKREIEAGCEQIDANGW